MNDEDGDDGEADGLVQEELQDTDADGAAALGYAHPLLLSAHTLRLNPAGALASLSAG
jgi:hypothetical protein